MACTERRGPRGRAGSAAGRERQPLQPLAAQSAASPQVARKASSPDSRSRTPDVSKWLEAASYALRRRHEGIDVDETRSHVNEAIDLFEGAPGQGRLPRHQVRAGSSCRKAVQGTALEPRTLHNGSFHRSGRRPLRGHRLQACPGHRRARRELHRPQLR